MSMSLKKFSIAALIFFIMVFNAYAQTLLKDLQENVANLSETMAKSLPFNSSIGQNWSDAYIGKFLPSVPPHFGAGLSIGATSLEISGVSDVAGLLGVQLPDIGDKLFIPAYALEARIGGFFLPFDIGAKFGIIPPIKLPVVNVDVNYTMAGIDVRYALIEGNVILPDISVGLGFNYLSGGIGVPIGTGTTTFGFNSNTLSIQSPEVNFLWETKVIEVKAQISKSFVIVTPFAGIGAGYSWSKAGYEIKSEVKLNGSVLNEDNIKTIQDYLSAEGLEGIDLSGKGFSSIVERNSMHVRAFGGLSVNLTIIRLNLALMINLLDGQFGGTFGVRVQL